MAAEATLPRTRVAVCPTAPVAGTVEAAVPPATGVTLAAERVTVAATGAATAAMLSEGAADDWRPEPVALAGAEPAVAVAADRDAGADCVALTGAERDDGDAAALAGAEPDGDATVATAAPEPDAGANAAPEPDDCDAGAPAAPEPDDASRLCEPEPAAGIAAGDADVAAVRDGAWLAVPADEALCGAELVALNAPVAEAEAEPDGAEAEALAEPEPGDAEVVALDAPAPAEPEPGDAEAVALDAPAPAEPERDGAEAVAPDLLEPDDPAAASAGDWAAVAVDVLAAGWVPVPAVALDGLVAAWADVPLTAEVAVAPRVLAVLVTVAPAPPDVAAGTWAAVVTADTAEETPEAGGGESPVAAWA